MGKFPITDARTIPLLVWLITCVYPASDHVKVQAEIFESPGAQDHKSRGVFAPVLSVTASDFGRSAHDSRSIEGTSAELVFGNSAVLVEIHGVYSE